MTPRADRTAGLPTFGTPGYAAWIRSVLAEKVINLCEGFPAGYARFSGAQADLDHLLHRAGILGLEIPGSPTYPPITPEAPIFVKQVRPDDLWTDRIEVLAFERLMGEALAVGCMFGNEVEFILAPDRGGQRLLDALRYGTSPPRLIVSGAQGVTSATYRSQGAEAGVSQPGGSAIVQMVPWQAHPDEVRSREMEDAAAVVATTEMLWAEVDRQRARLQRFVAKSPQFAGGMDDLYYDFQSGQSVPERHREIVDAIIHDPSYDPDRDGDYDRDATVARHAGHLDKNEYDVVANGASYTYKYTFGRALQSYAIPWARELAAHPESRAGWSQQELEAWARSCLPQALDERLVRRIIWMTGQRLRHRANAVRILADDLYDRISPGVLDRVGFTTRRAERHEVLADALTDLPEEVRDLAGDHMISRERNERKKQREHRYATAARALIKAGYSPSVAAQSLAVSPAVLKRLMTSYPKDVRLAGSDPLTVLLRD